MKIRACVTTAGLALGLTLGIVGVASAGGMKIEPGMWEFQMTTQHPMSPTPMTETTSYCIDSPELSPADMPAQSEGCLLSDIAAETATMSWNVTCAQDGGTMTGEFKMTSAGTSVTGSSVMRLAAGEQQIEIKTSWTGKRTGPCN